MGLEENLALSTGTYSLMMRDSFLAYISILKILMNKILLS